jgi:uncharacterized damage-inducible protein DinB
MSDDWPDDFPSGDPDEREMLLEWLRFLRGAIVRKVEGLSEEDAHRRPEGKLISVLGVMNHLTHVEWRWMNGGMRGETVSRSEAEFSPGPELTIATAIAAYKEREIETEAIVRSLPLDAPCERQPGTDLRWVLVHLVNETARHAGHADAARELIDGATGE